jgi:dipeptidyl aminopeptidase/acylaminoacyl peptidase
MIYMTKRSYLSIFLCVGLSVLLVLSSAEAENQEEQASAFELTIENIMKGPELVGTPPSSIMWSVDSQKAYFQWRKPGEKKADFYSISRSNQTPQKTNFEELLKQPPLLPRSAYSLYRYYRFGRFGAEIKFDKEKKKALFVRDGDIHLLDVLTGKMTQLTFTDERESNANFTSDQKKIFFTCQNNLFTLSLEGGELLQRTSFSKKKPPEGKKPDEIEKWYREQQKELFEEFQKKQEARDQRSIFPSFPKRERRQPFFIKEEQYIRSLNLSPDEKSVFFIISEDQPLAKRTIVPNYLTQTGYTETIDSHTKAAQSSREYKAGIMSVSTGKVNWIEYGQGERKIFPVTVFWSPSGKHCVLTARSEDRKDEWLLNLDINTGKTSVLEHIHDDAWIGPLGLINVSWMPDSEHISYISEKDGYAHLYVASLDGKKINQLTKGKFEVYDARLSEDGQKWYLTTNEVHPGERYFYSMPSEGGRRTKITSLKGRSQVILSPDDSSLAILHSSSNHPAELYFQLNEPGAEAKKITLSTTEEFQSHPWYRPEIITFKARDGVDVYSRIYLPKKWHASRPAVIFIHGAGYLQNAHRGWSSYYREYMFHNFLMEQGYLVLDVDYRGSAGYGRDCRTAIYRHMGGKDLDDIIDAAQFLVKDYKVNPERLGVYGGSYGGFLTLMAMFTAPDIFKAGASLRPVTDWAHYHPGYTVDILNLPHKDIEAYKQSSPIYFAQGLKGALLICHGMVDTNVHFQDTARLVQRLIELGKENWEVAIYPAEGHSFRSSSSWTDEYTRIFKLFEENLK